LKVDRASKKNNKIELPKLEKKLPTDVSIKSKQQIDVRKYKNKERLFM
jgi:hypothetical protein